MDLFGNTNNNDRVPSVMVGVVKGNNDQQNPGMVKIQYLGRSESEQTYWAPVATFMAGNSRGAFFLPEVNDVVVVAFELGDINKPIVIGSLWGERGGDRAPESNSDGKNNVRKIKSRAGHEFTFNDDKSGKAYVEIKTKAGHIIKLNDESSKEMISIKSKAGHSIVLDDTSGSEKIDIKDKSGTSKLNFDSSQKSIKMSSQNITIEGTKELKLKANTIVIDGTKVDVKASANLTLKGAMIKLN